MTTNSNHLFNDWPRTPAAHFRLFLFAAVSRLLRQVVETLGTHQETFEQFPFLIGYNEELAAIEPNGLDGEELDEWWRKALLEWEAQIETNLPIRSLRDACGLDDEAIKILICAGLIEEDSRFGLLFEAIQDAPLQRRPTIGLLQAWWRDEDGYAGVRARLRHLRELGLIQLINVEAPGLECATQVNSMLWDVLRGDVCERPAAWLSWRAQEALADMDELIIADHLRNRVKTLMATLTTGETQALIIRGPQRNGRRTLLGAMARSMGKGLLEIIGLHQSKNQANEQGWQPDDPRWQIACTMATMLRAVLVVVCEINPGESLDIPQWRGGEGFIGVVLGRHGGVNGVSVERAVTLQVDMPDPAVRRSHWKIASGRMSGKVLEQVSERFRMTSGNIIRAAKLALIYAGLDGRHEINMADVQQASRSLNRQTLETLATPITVSGDWNSLAVGCEAMEELRLLEIRCRHRERLRQALGVDFGAHLTAGVRAMFSGPSGTGKTLAAKLLASALQMDLYRLDLSAVVNKYIGETEKNLNQIFARAEELDVILLLDEGDALLTQRTEVSNANDRYANLETNYLLQRLESFEGILIVTTNAGDRIDNAFQRRMDVIVNFPPPDVMERWMIWRMHLPAKHDVQADFLNEVAMRCEMTGGQIRNAALHASLLALNDGEMIQAKHLESSLQREYRKSGSVCPMRNEINDAETVYRW